MSKSADLTGVPVYRAVRPCMRILYVTQIVPYAPHGGVLQRRLNLLWELGNRHKLHLIEFHHRHVLPPGAAVEQSRREHGRFCGVVKCIGRCPKPSAMHRVVSLAAATLHQAPFGALAHSSRHLSEPIVEACNGANRPDLMADRPAATSSTHEARGAATRRAGGLRRATLERPQPSRVAGSIPVLNDVHG